MGQLTGSCHATFDPDILYSRISSGLGGLLSLDITPDDEFWHVGAHVMVGDVSIGIGGQSPISGHSRARDDYGIILPLQGQIRYMVGRSEHVVRPEGNLYCVHREESLWEARRLTSMTIRLDSARLRATHAAMLGRPGVEFISGSFEIDMSSSVQAARYRALRYGIATALAGLDDPTLISTLRLEDHLLRSAALLFDGTAAYEEVPMAHDGRTRAHMARDLMASALSHKWTLTELESLSGLGRRALQLHFLREFGVPPMRWLNGYRLELAHDLLAQGQVSSVTEAASRVGMEHLGEFSRRFKLQYNCHPRDVLRAGSY
jgi:AraC-like DNA-binding protein